MLFLYKPMLVFYGQQVQQRQARVVRLVRRHAGTAATSRTGGVGRAVDCEESNGATQGWADTLQG